MTTVVFVGNCQADSLFRAYADWIGPERGETVQYVPAYAEADAATREAIRQADVAVMQVFDAEQKLSVADLETNARVIRFPHVSASFLWPFHGGTHPRNADIPPAYGAIFTGAFGDRWLNKRIARGDDPQTILERYRDPDVVMESQLDRVVELVTMHQQKRDERCDMRVGDYIMTNLASERVFTHMHHPSLELFALMLREVFSRIGCSSVEIERALSHHRAAPFPPWEMPIHPRVAEHLGIKWASDDLKYRLPLFGDRVTWQQYCQRYIAHDWNEPLQRCLALAGQQSPQAELGTLAADLETAAAKYDSTDGYYALSDLRHRMGDLDGSLAAIRHARSREPLWWHYATRHARLLIQIGHLEEALTVAEDAATWHPKVADARMTLSDVYYRLGRQHDALREARAARAIIPDHPWLVHRLAELESASAGIGSDVSNAVPTLVHSIGSQTMSSSVAETPAPQFATLPPPNRRGDRPMPTTESLQVSSAGEPAAWCPPVDAGPTTVAGFNVEHVLIDRAVKELYRPNPARTTFSAGSKAEVYAIAARTIGAGPLTYLEFGVSRGGSMQQISALFRDPAATFVGFDSFEGLPGAWGPFMPGHFSTDGAAPSMGDSRIRFVKGWFQNSVPPFLRANKLHGPVLVNFDADMYTSTLFLLTTLWHHIPEYYFIFDEFVPSEIVAMYDFARAYPVAFEFFACTVDDRDRPLQIFGRLRNAVYEPTSPR